MLARRCCQAAKPPSTTRAVMATPLSTKPVTSVVVKPGRTQPRQTPSALDELTIAQLSNVEWRMDG